MLTGLSLKNFKCYQEETHFELGKINLLTGINGKGKSSLLQSLLLFRQSVEHNPNTTSLFLNGNCVRLGEFTDVKNANTSSKEPIVFDFYVSYEDADNLKFWYVFDESLADKRSLLLKNMGVESDKKIIMNNPFKDNSKTTWGEINRNDKGEYINIREEMVDTFSYLLPDELNIQRSSFEGRRELQDILNFQKIHYICADRLGPQEFYAKNNIGDFVHVGKQGELVADVLSYAKKEQIVVSPEIALNKDRFVGQQASAWLSQILDNPNIAIQLDDDDKFRSSISFHIDGKSYTPPNVGFGYSYTLPIIVAGLMAKEGEILIVENPEAHLHPKAQSRLADFLAKVSNTGVQVFIESHSDHILNAMRVAVKNKHIAPEDVKVFFFANNEDKTSTSPKIFKPQIDIDGRIEEWPDGFFDEWNNNLLELL